MGSKAVTALKVSCLQLAAGSDWKKNLDHSLRLAQKALSSKPDVLILPENFLWRGSSKQFEEIACRGSVSALSLFQAFARRYHVSVLLGSLMMPSSRKGRYRNTSILLSETGKVEAS